MNNKEYCFNLGTAISITSVLVIGFSLAFLRFEESLTPHQPQYENRHEQSIKNG